MCVQRPGAPAFAISSADDGLAGRYRAIFPGISLPFGILSWPLTSALLHCEDAGKGAYNLLLTGSRKVRETHLDETERTGCMKVVWRVKGAEEEIVLRRSGTLCPRPSTQSFCSF